MLATMVATLAADTPAYAVSCARPAAIAHRGGTEKYPENTRQAFRWATDVAGAKWWETDIQFDATETPFILHDDTLDRTTNGTGPVSAVDLSAARTHGLRVDGGYTVPSLYEVLSDAAARPGVQVQAELKTVPTPAQLAKVLARLNWTGMRSRVVLTSFDPAALDVVKAQAPDVRRALISALGDQDPATITTHGQIYSKHQWAVTADRLARWRAAGLQVTVWTPDDPAAWRRMASYGAVYGIITDKPNAYRLAAVC